MSCHVISYTIYIYIYTCICHIHICLYTISIHTYIYIYIISYLNGHYHISEEIDKNNTMTVKNPVVNEKIKTKVSIGS